MRINRRIDHLQKVTSSIILGLVFFILLTIAIRYFTKDNTLGADFFIYYNAGRTASTEHISPYDPAITLQTQIDILGHPAPPGEDQLAFVYPAFALIPLLPLFLIDFSWSQAIWMALNIVLLTGLILITTPKPKLSALSYLLFYPVAFSLILGNLNGTISMIVLFLAVKIFLTPAPARQTQIIAGILLSWAVVKPQFIWLFTIYFILTALSRKLIPFLVSFLIGFVTLLGLSIYLWPNWILEWISATYRYSGYVKANFTIAASLTQIISNPLLNIILGISSISCLIASVLIFRESIHHFHKETMIRTFCWVGYITYLFHPNGTSYEQLTIYIPFLIWFTMSLTNRIFIKTIIWIIAVVLSWVAFYLTYTKIYPRAVYDLTLIFFTSWILYQFKNNLTNLFSRKAGLNRANI